MRILGIDPGIRNTGWGVIDTDGSRLRHLGNGVIQPNPNDSDSDRLASIASGLLTVISTHSPDCAAIEEIFVAKSAASALKLGMARGVAMMVCGQNQLTVTEIAARLVKKTVTGTGTADKRQIQDMVHRLLNVHAANADAADALAIAIAGGSLVASPLGIISGNAQGAGVGSSQQTMQQQLQQKSAGAKGGSNLSKAIEAALARDRDANRRRDGSNEDGQ